MTKLIKKKKNLRMLQISTGIVNSKETKDK